MSHFIKKYINDSMDGLSKNGTTWICGKYVTGTFTLDGTIDCPSLVSSASLK